MPNKVVLFELNEVPWRVLEDFVDAYPHSCLARLLPQMHPYETHAEDSSLSPWITWPSLHRGVSDEHHTITDFGQDLSEINAAYPSIWELLVDAGVPTGVFGALHSYPLPKNVGDYRFYVPDVFAAGSECFPRGLERFQAFNLAMSRASARNVSAGLPRKAAASLVANASGLGITPATLVDLGRHLLDERRAPWTKVRRRTYQVVLAFDIFMRQLECTRPAFATFFTNHVASSMHRFWAARYPGDYQTFGYSDAWVGTYRHEITWTMAKCDRMLSRLAAFVERLHDYQLWVATSMGQAATEASAVQTQVYLRDVGAFMRRLGFGPSDWEIRPAMLPRVIVAMRNGKAESFKERLRGIHIADRGPLPWKALGHNVFRIHPGALQNVRDEFCLVDDRRIPFVDLGFANVEIQDSAGQSAYHIPQGVLLIYDPRHPAGTANKVQISTLDVAPMICSALGVDPPKYMQQAALAATGT